MPARCKHKLKFVWRRTIPIADTYYFKCDICGMGKYIEVARFWKVPAPYSPSESDESYLERLLGRKPTEKDLYMRDTALRSIMSRSQPEAIEEGVISQPKHFGISDELANEFQEALDRNEIYRAGFADFDGRIAIPPVTDDERFVLFNPDRNIDYLLDYDRYL